MQHRSWIIGVCVLAGVNHPGAAIAQPPRAELLDERMVIARSRRWSAHAQIPPCRRIHPRRLA